MRIKEVEVKNGDTLIFRFSAPDKLRRYLFSDSFYVRYDRPIEDVPRSIQYIPGVAGLATLCWAKNTDLRVGELDSRYLESMRKVRGVLNDFYPGIGFHGDVVCDREVDNSFGNQGTGLLFSGGVDSTALYLEERKLKPILFSIIGGVIPVENQAFINLFKQTYRRFADGEGVKIHFIETNIRAVLNEALLFADYREQLRRPWWELVNQGTVYLGLSSPLTTADVGFLKIASSGSPLIEATYGTHPLIDNKTGWGDVEVIHSQQEYTKQEKVHRFIKKLIEEEGTHPTLQVCNYNPLLSDSFNCNQCQKCLGTIISLLVERIDPTMCGFKMSENMYTKIKKDVIPSAHARWLVNWKNIQDRINFKEGVYLHNSEEFFRWLKEADLDELNQPEEGINLEKLLLPIQARLPRSFQRYFLKKYYRWKHRL